MTRLLPQTTKVSLGKFHQGQEKAFWALKPHRFKALRCGRRFGKTEFAKTWIADGLTQGFECAWFSPQNRTWSEVYHELCETLRAIVESESKTAAAIRCATGARLDFWTLENSIAGRGRRYRRIVIDEAAFVKNGDNTINGSMMEIWEKSIKPTLFDYAGEALICSNSAGKNPDNFFYNICTDAQYGFVEYHATTMNNPLLPKRNASEPEADWLARRAQLLADLRQQNDPLVYAQEYLADFVDWAGAAFFAREKLLDQNNPVSFPNQCDAVFAVIDTASKTGTENDATAVTYFAKSANGSHPLIVLDWDIVQIEGAILESWLPIVFKRLEELAGQCRAKYGALGAWIEDQNSGTVLLQQALRRSWRAYAIDSKLTALGKDERAISVSGYVHRGQVKYSKLAFEKITVHKRRSMNHLVHQIESFRVGDKDSRREDDLLDTFCYGVAIALGNRDGF